MRQKSLFGALVLLLPGLVAGQTSTNLGSEASATVIAEGSTLTHHPLVDGASGQVYVYVGGDFPIGTIPVAFRFLWDAAGPDGNNTGYLTPLLFERSAVGDTTIFTVVGVGQASKVSVSPSPVTVPFAIVDGIRVTNDHHVTFGYINAIANALGLPHLTSPGTIDYIRPAVEGPGVAGMGSNNIWAATKLSPSPNVGLGTTFGFPGSGADYLFDGTTRTYSAEAYGYLKTQ